MIPVRKGELWIYISMNGRCQWIYILLKWKKQLCPSWNDFNSICYFENGYNRTKLLHLGIGNVHFSNRTGILSIYLILNRFARHVHDHCEDRTRREIIDSIRVVERPVVVLPCPISVDAPASYKNLVQVVTRIESDSQLNSRSVECFHWEHGSVCDEGIHEHAFIPDSCCIFCDLLSTIWKYIIDNIRRFKQQSLNWRKIIYCQFRII